LQLLALGFVFSSEFYSSLARPFLFHSVFKFLWQKEKLLQIRQWKTPKDQDFVGADVAEIAMWEASIELHKELIVVASIRATRAVKQKAEKEVATRRREMKEKAVCKEDLKARRNAREVVSIARFFSSSRNANNQQSFFVLCAPSDPASGSS